MDLEPDILSEVSQTKTNTVRDCLHVEFKIPYREEKDNIKRVLFLPQRKWVPEGAIYF